MANGSFSACCFESRHITFQRLWHDPHTPPSSLPLRDDITSPLAPKLVFALHEKIYKHSEIQRNFSFPAFP